MIKAFMFDIDGTIIDENYVMTQKTIDALKKLKKNGYILVANSGRPIFLSNYVSDKTLGENFFDYVYGNNGSEYYNPKTKEFRLLHHLTKDEIHKIGELYKKDIFTLGVYEQSDTENKILINKPVDSKEKQDWYDARGLKIEVIDFNDIDKNYSKAICIHEEKYYDEAAKFMDENVTDYCSVTHSSRRAVEIVPKGVSKATAVKDFMKQTGLKKEEIISFGDSNNDIPMLLETTGVIMGNAIQAHKDLIEQKTLSVKDDGVFDYLLKNHYLD